MRILIVGLGLLLLSSVAEAQPLVSTQNGSANPNSVQLFSLLPLLGGQVDVSISWTNRNAVYRLRVLGQWFDGIRFYAAASSPRRSRRTWAGLR